MVRRSRERDRAACNASAPRKTAARRAASRHKRIGSGSSTPRPLGLQTHATTRNQFSEVVPGAADVVRVVVPRLMPAVW